MLTSNFMGKKGKKIGHVEAETVATSVSRLGKADNLERESKSDGPIFDGYAYEISGNKVYFRENMHQQREDGFIDKRQFKPRFDLPLFFLAAMKVDGGFAQRLVNALNDSRRGVDADEFEIEVRNSEGGTEETGLQGLRIHDGQREAWPIPWPEDDWAETVRASLKEDSTGYKKTEDWNDWIAELRAAQRNLLVGREVAEKLKREAQRISREGRRATKAVSPEVVVPEAKPERKMKAPVPEATVVPWGADEDESTEEESAAAPEVVVKEEEPAPELTPKPESVRAEAPVKSESREPESAESKSEEPRHEAVRRELQLWQEFGDESRLADEAAMRIGVATVVGRFREIAGPHLVGFLAGQSWSGLEMQARMSGAERPAVTREQVVEATRQAVETFTGIRVESAEATPAEEPRALMDASAPEKAPEQEILTEDEVAFFEQHPGLRGHGFAVSAYGGKRPTAEVRRALLPKEKKDEVAKEVLDAAVREALAVAGRGNEALAEKISAHLADLVVGNLRNKPEAEKFRSDLFEVNSRGVIIKDHEWFSRMVRIMAEKIAERGK